MIGLFALVLMILYIFLETFLVTVLDFLTCTFDSERFVRVTELTFAKAKDLDLFVLKHKLFTMRITQLDKDPARLAYLDVI